MAISPNTDFTSGQILTATAANQWPRGIMQLVTGTSTVSLSGETLTLTLPAFTAVANRYYRVTYYEPSITINSGTIEMKLRLTNISGTIQAAAQQISVASESAQGILTIVKTFSAGSTVLVASVNAANGNCYRDATEYKAQLCVEDLGPA